MSRTLVNIFRWVSLLVGVACLLAIPVQGVPIVATPQVTPKRVFKVCLLLLQSQKSATTGVKYWNSDPWILPVLNSSLYKPSGWILDNPLAPGCLSNPLDSDLLASGEEYAKDGKGGSTNLVSAWNPVVTSPYKTNWYTNGKSAGDPISKNDPAYWVVKLDQKSIDALAQFDLVIVNGHNRSTLSNADRDNLQLLLNRGATIWLNNSQREGNQLTNFFLDPAIKLHQGPYNDTNKNTHMSCVDPESWLISSYYSLTDNEVQYLRDSPSEYSYIIPDPKYGLGSLIGEVVRLYSTDFPYPGHGQPAIAAGRVGAGQLIVTATDCIGATSDWWEYLHNHDANTPPVWVASTLSVAPYCQLVSATDPAKSATSNLNQSLSYIASCKFFFNMLSRPSSWHMPGGNVLASRFFPQAFSTSLLRSYATTFTTLNDPVTYGRYVAVTGTESTGASKLRIYQLNDPTADRAMTGLWNLPPPTTNYRWIGSPVFGRIIETGSTIPETVVYALEGYCDPVAKVWTLRPHCFRVDTGADRWPASQTLAIPCAPGAIVANSTPTASITLSNNRLVVTFFGKTVNGAGNRICILDATTGIVCAVVGASPTWGTDFRLTGPASIITAPVNFQISPLEAGDLRITSVGGYSQRSEMVELLAVTGETYSTAGNQSVLFLIPPIAIARMSNRTITANGQSVYYGTPSLMTLLGSGGTTQQYPIGIANALQDPAQLRLKNIVAIKSSGDSVKILFRNFDIFVSQGSVLPKLTFPLTLKYSVSGTTPTQQVSIPITSLSMGYPIVLHGTQQFAVNNRLTLHLNDGDGTNTFGYQVDAPPAVSENQVIINTNCATQQALPFLQRMRIQDLGQQSVTSPSDPRLQTNLAFGGTVTAYRIASPELSQAAYPAGRTSGDIIWQFYGNNFGPPPPTGTTTPVLPLDQDNLPALWHSNFPFAPAVGKDAVYALGIYNKAFSGPVTGELNTTITPEAYDLGRGVLYALDTAPSRFLQQVVTAGTGVRAVAGNVYQLTMSLPANGPLHVGARALLTCAGGTWDMGTVQLIRGTVDQNGAIAAPYTVTFDRSTPPTTLWNGTDAASLLAATTTPYVSHVQGWDAIAGAQPITTYNRAGSTMNRISQGICSTYPPAIAPANPFDFYHGELMIAFTQLQSTCHDPKDYAGTTVSPSDAAYPLDASWKEQPYVFMPRLAGNGLQGSATAPAAGTYTPARIATNFLVDYRSGRIELSPEAAGQYADRFVVVHYMTTENTGGGAQQTIHHAEVMHIPSQIKWQYLFSDAVPDGSPVVVNDTIYVTANRLVAANTWQPTVYAFAVHPDNTLNVQPKWQQPVGPSVTNAQQPYRGVTAAIPTANGVLVGTELLGPNGSGNQLSLFSDRGVLIADGHRILRTNGDSLVTWQASATKDYDLAAQGAPDDQTIAAGVQQQAFTLITRIQRLPNSGNILVCDTGGNRVVEMDRNGTVIWQYPDSDLHMTGNPTTPKSLRLNGPRDVRRYTHMNPATINGHTASVWWDVTLIADTGNSRILEVCRPYVKFDDVTIQGPGYQYKPSLTVNGIALQQIQEVIADGTTVQFNNTALGQTLNFTVARRYPDVSLVAYDNVLQDTVNPVFDGVRSKQVLAVIGNPVPDPLLKNTFLRTVMLARSSSIDGNGNYVPLAIAPSATPATNGANALFIRKGSPYDFVNVRQLDLITLTNSTTGNPEIHALVVDQVGVREVAMTDQTHPVFEMTQTEYTTALSAASWTGVMATLYSTDQTKLTNWLANDHLFAPAAVLRIDPGSKQTGDQQNVRYLISQMNTLVPRDDPYRRILLFEARYIGPTTAYDPHFWGLADSSNNYYMFPNPLSPDYPNLPGTTYPLTQPLSIDRD